jgi:hypothetical protein
VIYLDSSVALAHLLAPKIVFRPKICAAAVSLNTSCFMLARSIGRMAMQYER